MLVVSIEKSGPLLWTNTKTCVHGHLDNLTVMLATKGLVRTKLDREIRDHVSVCVSGCNASHIKYGTDTEGHSVDHKGECLYVMWYHMVVLGTHEHHMHALMSCDIK